MKESCQSDYERSVQPQPARKRILGKLRIPQWFRDFFFRWIALMLTLAAVGYGAYVLSGGWTPDHLLRFLMLGL